MSPGPRGAATAPTVILSFAFNSFEAGGTAHQYRIRRRKLAPTLGSYEYWTGAAWGASTWIAAPGSTFDGDVIAVSTGAGWANNEVFEWSVDMRNTALEESGFADANLLSVHVKPTATFSVADPALDSRPTVKWAFVGGTGRRQQCMQLALYTAATATDPDFNPNSEVWQDMAVWKMDDPHYSSILNEMEIGVDLTSASTYHLYYKVCDDYGYENTWLLGDTFTTSIVPPSAPSLTAVRVPGTGTVKINVASTFNLMDADESEMTENLGSWIPLENCALSWSPANGGCIEMDITGMTYDAMDAAHASFDAQDAAYASFNAQRDAQSATVGVARAAHGPALAANMIPVTVAQVYSAIASFKPITDNKMCRVDIEWYSAAPALLSTSTGTNTNCPIGVQTPVPCNAKTAPASAAYARIVLRVESTPGHTVEIDSVAFSQTSSIVWTPGGLSVDLRYVLQRREGTGPWQFLWGATRTSPLRPDNDVSSSVEYYDRGAILGSDDVQYRAFNFTEATGPIVYSAPTTVAVPAFNEHHWWLRCVSGLVPDVQIRVSDFDISEGHKVEAIYPRNQEYGFVVSTTEAKDRSLRARAMTTSKEEYEELETILNSGELLYLQRNVGDGFYFRVTGDVNKQQRRARDLSTENRPVRHLHDWSFSGEVVSPEEALT